MTDVEILAAALADAIDLLADMNDQIYGVFGTGPYKEHEKIGELRRVLEEYRSKARS